MSEETCNRRPCKHGPFRALKAGVCATAAGYNGYETSYTSYGAGGGAGGGGFIPGEGGSTQSPGGRQDRAQDTLRPVTIKQILDAQLEAGSNDAFKIDGTVVTQVCAVPLWPICLC